MSTPVVPLFYYVPCAEYTRVQHERHVYTDCKVLKHILRIQSWAAFLFCIIGNILVFYHHHFPPFSVVLFSLLIKSRAFCMLGQHSTVNPHSPNPSISLSLNHIPKILSQAWFPQTFTSSLGISHTPKASVITFMLRLLVSVPSQILFFWGGSSRQDVSV